MQTQPVIGIVPECVPQLPDQLSRGWLAGRGYVQPLIDLGALPWIIPLLDGNEKTLAAIYARLDGLYLIGGLDIDPQTYGEPRHPHCGRTDLQRDWVETQLTRWAMRDRKPILGVCRGCQLINVAAGGTLYQDVPTEFAGAIQHDVAQPAGELTRIGAFHPVRIEAGSRLRAILGAGELAVNSIHHQAVKDLAPSLKATALAPDGLIEGIEGKEDHYLIGVQWHPEEMDVQATPMGALFESFLQAARVASHGRRG
ncbi:MAG TPA: gamma-glutamyl-gamma-aminobutyrate hydrolase family protein [Gemmataceae bacterium]|nr:gamma-glutamyl-gamma-aminobutyrate hydrolase family protein [Gemmataceae bacterium]